MLTKNDLQQIKTLFHDETRKVVREETITIIQKELDPVKKQLDELVKTQHSMKRQLTRVAKDVRYISADYDKRIEENHREIQKIKQHVGSVQ